MPYSITTTSGAPVATVQDATINTTSTALTLIGRDYAGYGAFLNENFVHILENFANDTAPTQKLTGQIWYDTSANTLKVWNTSLNKWKPISSSLAQDVAPTGASSSQGDLWFDTANNQLHAYNDGWQLIGPSTVGADGTISGAVVETIQDSSDNNRVVVKLYIQNTIVGIFSSSSAFTPKNSINGFTLIYPGFTLAGSSAIPNSQFTGDASNALKLNGVTSGQFLRADQDTSTPHSLSAGNLIVGTALALNEISSNNEVQISSLLNGYNLNLYSNFSGTPSRALGVSGTTGSITVDNSLSVAGTLNVSGAFTANGTTTLVDVTTLQNKIIPNATGTVDIGASNKLFANVYATNFSGTFAGNLVSSQIIVGNVTISQSAVTVNGNALTTQSYVASYVQTAGRNSQGTRTISTSPPSGGSAGDIWYQV
jgi:hypothetical protein